MPRAAGTGTSRKASRTPARRARRRRCAKRAKSAVWSSIRARFVDLGRFAYRPDKDLWLHAALIERIDPKECVCSTFFTDRRGRRLPEMDAFRWLPFAAVATHCAKSMATVLTTKLSLDELLERLRAARRALTRGARRTASFRRRPLGFP